MLNKKSFAISLVTIATLTISSPISVSATNIDDKINQQEQKINDLNNQKAAADKTLAGLESQIATLKEETQQLLDEKVALEQEVAQLNKEIADLEEAIQKRSEKIDEQARETQVNQDKQNIVSVLLEADSVSDAINRTLAYGTLVSANNSIMEDQKRDKDDLAQKKQTLEEKVAAITKKQEAFKVKQTELEASKAEQVKLANDILNNLANEKDKKAEYVAQKAEAERIAAEAARKQKELEKQQKEAEQATQAAVQKVTGEENVSQSNNVSSSGTANSGAQTKPQTPAPAPQTGSGFQSPLSSLVVTSGFGYRADPTGNAGNFHSGIDFGGSMNTPVMAARAGTVIAAGFEPGGGNHIIIQHDNGYYTYYLHLNQHVASVGASVQAGDVVGLMGTTGDSTGVHLHFGISTGFWSGYLNPGPFLGI